MALGAAPVALIRDPDRIKQQAGATFVDVRPAIDTRTLFEGLLRDFRGLSGSDLESAVFPDAATVKPLYDLITI